MYCDITLDGKDTFHMDSIQALKTLDDFETLTRCRPGVVKKTLGASFESHLVHFHAGPYRVVVRMIIGPGGYVGEDHIVMDTRPKSHKIEKLVCANFGLRPSPNGEGKRSLVLSTVVKTSGMSRWEAGKVVRRTLEDFVQQAMINPEQIIRHIEEVAPATPTLR